MEVLARLSDGEGSSASLSSSKSLSESGKDLGVC